MSSPVTIRDIFEAHKKELGLEWVTGGQEDRQLTEIDTRHSDNTLIGHLNLVRPNYIQVLAATELAYLDSLGKNSLHDSLKNLADSRPLMVIIADGTRRSISLATAPGLSSEMPNSSASLAVLCMAACCAVGSLG